MSIATSYSLQVGGGDSVDGLQPPQVAQMSSYFAEWKIISVRADFLVELRGFEPLTSASQASAREAAPPCGSPRRNREARPPHRRLLLPTYISHQSGHRTFPGVCVAATMDEVRSTAGVACSVRASPTNPSAQLSPTARQSFNLAMAASLRFQRPECANSRHSPRVRRTRHIDPKPTFSISIGMGGESHKAVIGANARVRKVQSVVVFQKEFSRTDRVCRANADVWPGGVCDPVRFRVRLDGCVAGGPEFDEERAGGRTSALGAGVMGLDAALLGGRGLNRRRKGICPFCKSVTTVAFANRGSTARRRLRAELVEAVVVDRVARQD
jgi:hypothetical protein